MKLFYFIKLILKATLLLAVLLTCVLVLYDNALVSRIGERIKIQEIQIQESVLNQTYDKLSHGLEHNEDSKSASKNGIQKQLINRMNDSDLNSNGLYLTSTEVEFAMTSEAQWRDHQANLKFNARYWDLVKSSNPNGSRFRLSKGQHNESKPCFKTDLINLWRPTTSIAPGPEDNNRIVPQLVWQMEAVNSSFAHRFKQKKILVWDTFKWWSKADWRSSGGQGRQLLQSDCKLTPNSLTQCIFTDDRAQVHDADAVIAARDVFHTGEVSVPEDAYKFYFMLESPFHSWASLNRPKDLLATYWRGSDVVTPYSTWVYYDQNLKLMPQSKNYSLGKSKPGAMFVSNCNAWNDRMGFINELQKYIQVDVYGNCGTFRCERSREHSCFDMLKKDYYFYFAFENSNCRDYITEKLFTNGLSNDVIPVVMGGHPDDYKALAPYKSYIHVEEFDNPKGLSEYLTFLIKNPAEYNKYFEWKGTGEFITSDFFCRICAMVHYADLVPPPERKKKTKWGHMQAIKSGMCLDRNKWYWSRKSKNTILE